MTKHIDIVNCPVCGYSYDSSKIHMCEQILEQINDLAYKEVCEDKIGVPGFYKFVKDMQATNPEAYPTIKEAMISQSAKAYIRNYRRTVIGIKTNLKEERFI